jgi:hypothetical protein
MKIYTSTSFLFSSLIFFTLATELTFADVTWQDYEDVNALTRSAIQNSTCVLDET